MKSAVLNIQILVFLILLIVPVGCKKAKLPVVITKPFQAISIHIKTAAGNGIVSDDGGATVVERGACWSTSENPTVDDDRVSDGNGTGSFDIYMERLSAGTLYYVRTYARNIAGTGYGNQVYFRTLPPATPLLITASVTAITQTTAVSGGNVLDDNGDEVIERGVCWGTDIYPTISENKTIDGKGPGVFVSNITGLLSGTTYYLSAYAVNNKGVGYGDIVTFTAQ